MTENWFTITIGETVRIIETEKEIKNWLKQKECTQAADDDYIRKVNLIEWDTRRMQNVGIHMRNGIAVARNKYCQRQIIYDLLQDICSFTSFVFSRERFLAETFKTHREHGSRLNSNYQNLFIVQAIFAATIISFWLNKTHRMELRRRILQRSCVWVKGGRCKIESYNPSDESFAKLWELRLQRR